jgi:hypothetical protein
MLVGMVGPESIHDNQRYKYDVPEEREDLRGEYAIENSGHLQAPYK